MVLRCRFLSASHAEKEARRGNAQNLSVGADIIATTHGHMIHAAGAVQFLTRTKRRTTMISGGAEDKEN